MNGSGTERCLSHLWYLESLLIAVCLKWQNPRLASFSNDMFTTIILSAWPKLLSQQLCHYEETYVFINSICFYISAHWMMYNTCDWWFYIRIRTLCMHLPGEWQDTVQYEANTHIVFHIFVFTWVHLLMQLSFSQLYNSYNFFCHRVFVWPGFKSIFLCLLAWFAKFIKLIKAVLYARFYVFIGQGIFRNNFYTSPELKEGWRNACHYFFQFVFERPQFLQWLVRQRFCILLYSQFNIQIL